MAQILLTTKLLLINSELLPAMREYFDSVVELMPTVPHTRKYELIGRGLPEDETYVILELLADGDKGLIITGWRKI